MEKLEILNKKIENGYITEINWYWEYTDENVNSYSISGLLVSIEHELVLDKNITDNTLLVILENILQSYKFKEICYDDLNLNNN
jgi:hypothetical protein